MKRIIFTTLFALTLAFLSETAFAENPPTTCATITQIPLTECHALQAIADLTPQPLTTTSWFLDAEPCGWNGLTCNAAQTHIFRLDLTDNGLTTIPTEIGDFSQLDALILEQNHLQTIPSSIASLQNLTFLDLEWNELPVFPQPIFALTNLVYLELGTNEISVVPADIDELANLRSIDLGKNSGISTLPPEFASLTQLEYLFLYENQFVEIPSPIFGLTNLTDLYMAKNQISQIPPSITSLTQLRSLGLQQNLLTTLPAEMSTMQSLERLYLDYNQIAPYPAETIPLIALKELHLSGNQITDLPDEMTNYASLDYLNLYANQLKRLSDHAPTFPIDEIILDWNPLCVPGYQTEVSDWLDDIDYLGYTNLCHDWAVMVYLNGDNNLESQTKKLFNRLELAVYQNPALQIRVLWDKWDDGDTVLYDVQPNSHSLFLANYTENVNRWSQGELDLGDPATLAQFITDTRTALTAENYFLSIVDHGGGWSPEILQSQGTARWKAGGGGMSWDETNGFSYLSTQDLETVFASFTDDPLDVVFYDACLMATAEDAYALRDGVDLLIASQNETWTAFPYHTYLELLETRDPLDLTTHVLDSYYDVVATNDYAMTASVIQTSNIRMIQPSLDNLALSLLHALTDATNRPLIQSAYDSAQKLDGDYDLELSTTEGVVDLIHFATKLSENFDGVDSDVVSAAIGLINDVNDVILYERHATGSTGIYNTTMNLDNSNGLSIYLPFGEIHGDLQYYDDVGQVSLSDDGFWDEFIFDFLQIAQTGGVGPGGSDGQPPQPIDPPPPTEIRLSEIHTAETSGTSSSSSWKPLVLSFVVLTGLSLVLRSRYDSKNFSDQ